MSERVSEMLSADKKVMEASYARGGLLAQNVSRMSE